MTKRGSRRSVNEMGGIGCLLLLVIAASGCQKKDAAAAGGGPAMQGLPVQTISVSLAPVAQSSEYVSTIKSRRSATLMPQVSGALTAIGVRSGDRVKAGQEMMEIDPRQQQATVAAQRATERQKKAVYDYHTVEVERQRKLFDAGVTSRDVLDQEQQAFDNAKADYESAVESRKTQEQLLDYYTIHAPFDGVVGDVPVHVGDYVSPLSAPPTLLTTVDENRDLETYIYVPTERSADVRMGLTVQLLDNNSKLIETTKVDFISPQVDSGLQGILLKAPVHSGLDVLRNAQLVRARIIWNTAPKAVVPVLAVTRLGGQTFIYLAENQGGKFFARQQPITVGDTVGNDYAVESGLKNGDQVIITGTQFLVDGAPVIPLPPGPPPVAPHTGN